MQQKQKLGNRLGAMLADLVVRYPWRVLLLSVLLLAGMVPGIRELRSDFTYRVWYRESDPLVLRFDRFEQRFGNDDQVIVLMHSPSGIFDAESARFVRELTQKLWQVPNVIRVDSLANHNWIHASEGDIRIEPFLPENRELTAGYLAGRKRDALADETIPDYLLSRDGNSAVFYVTISPEIGTHREGTNIIAGVRSKIEELGDSGDHEFHVAGSIALTDAFREATAEDVGRLLPFVLGFIVLFLYFIYRSVVGVVLSVLVILLTLLATGGAAGWAGLTFNPATGLLPQIVIAVGIAVTVHVMTSFLRLRGSGASRVAAAHEAIAENFRPTVLTTATTAVGFFSFAPADIIPLAHLGIGSGFGMVAAWLFTFIFMGPLLVLMPVRAPARRAVRKRTVGGRPKAVTAWIARRSRRIVWVGLALSALGLFISSRNVPNSDPYAFFSKDFRLTVAMDALEKHLGGGKTLEIAIDSGVSDGIKDPEFLRKVERYQSWIGSLPYVSKTVSVVDILKSMNRALDGGREGSYALPDTREKAGQLLLLYGMNLPQGMDINHRITVANDAVRLTVLWRLRDSLHSLRGAKEIEDKAAEFGLKAEISGKLLLYHKMNAYVTPTFVWSILIATLVIALIMIVALGSIRLGLLSLLPNILPVAMGGAVVWLSGMYFDIGTAVVASVCLGIAVDDTVHFLVRYRDLIVAGKSPKEALEGVYETTGFAVAATTVVLVFSFGVFAFAEFVPNSSFGILCAAVLIMGLIFEFLFLPALLLETHQWLNLSPKPAKRVSGKTRVKEPAA